MGPDWRGVQKIPHAPNESHIPYRMHGICLFITYIWLIFMVYVHVSTSPMDPLGIGKLHRFQCLQMSKLRILKKNGSPVEHAERRCDKVSPAQPVVNGLYKLQVGRK